MADTAQIKELRDRTGCGVIDCQEALQEAGDDIEQAITLLRKKGKAQAAKKAERATQEGTVAAYIHNNGKIGVLVKILCETDFVAHNDKFQELAKNIAMHIAAMDPTSISPDHVPADTLAEEKAIAKDQAQKSKKPAEIQAKMVEGKLKKFREEQSLLTQPYVKDPAKTIQDLVNESVQELGENITISEFTRFSI